MKDKVASRLKAFLQAPLSPSKLLLLAHAPKLDSCFTGHKAVKEQRQKLARLKENDWQGLETKLVLACYGRYVEDVMLSNPHLLLRSQMAPQQLLQQAFDAQQMAHWQ